MKKKTLLLTILLAASTLFAQKMTGVPSAKEDTLYSAIVGDDYYLQITLPFPFNPNGKKYPVLFYLDAFATSARLNEFAAVEMYSKTFEPFIMVGISYNMYPSEHGNLRRRDYLPPLNEKDTIHHGDKFLKFIKYELIPYMENNYNTNPEDRGLLGSSLSGFFTTWVFKEEPNLFNKLAILSPSLQFDKGDFLLNSPEFQNNVKNEKNLSVFISYGSLEGDRFIALGEALYELLTTNPKIEVTKVIFTDETHGTVYSAASSRALHTLYRDQFKYLLGWVSMHYSKKEYKKGLEKYEKAFKNYPKRVEKVHQFGIARHYALTGDSDSAFRYLNMLVNGDEKWKTKIVESSDLKSLHNDERWELLLKAMKIE